MSRGFFSAYSLFIYLNLPFSLKKRSLTLRFTLLLPLFASLPASATNYYEEHQLSHVLEDAIDPMEITWLITNSPIKTLALYKQTEGVDKIGAALILPDFNHHPDWPYVISPIRHELPRFGWATLSLQMPFKRDNLAPLELEAIYDTTKARIIAALAYLKTETHDNIIIIAHRHSVGIAIRFLAENPDNADSISALVGISGYDTTWINSSFLLRKMAIPFLDIYAQDDNDEIIISAQKRLVSAKFAGKLIKERQTSSLSPKVQQLAKNKTGNFHYRQVQINGANKYFTQHQNTLTKTIRGWLNIHATATPSPTKPRKK